MIPVDDDIRSIIKWSKTRQPDKFWTEYLALVSGLYQEHEHVKIDYGTLTLEKAIFLIRNPAQRNHPVWLE